jgi:hypothetical protein
MRAPAQDASAGKSRPQPSPNSKRLGPRGPRRRRHENESRPRILSSSSTIEADDVRDWLGAVAAGDPALSEAEQAQPPRPKRALVPLATRRRPRPAGGFVGKAHSNGPKRDSVKPNAGGRRAQWKAGARQGQLQLNRCARNDFQQEIIAPTAAASLHHGALLLVRMLF